MGFPVPVLVRERHTHTRVPLLTGARLLHVQLCANTNASIHAGTQVHIHPCTRIHKHMITHAQTHVFANMVKHWTMRIHPQVPLQARAQARRLCTRVRTLVRIFLRGPRCFPAGGQGS